MVSDPLRVGIHQQHLFAFSCKPHAQIFAGRGFAGSAFLIDDGNRGCFFRHFYHPLFDKS